jgi:Ser/Thr protein kinase RdoA (MazF antagonist)
MERRAVGGGWAAFLDGYRAVRRLAEPDAAAIAPLVAARHVWYLGHRTASRGRWGASMVGPAQLDWMLAFFRDAVGAGDWT